MKGICSTRYPVILLLLDNSGSSIARQGVSTALFGSGENKGGKKVSFAVQKSV